MLRKYHQRYFYSIPQCPKQAYVTDIFISPKLYYYGISTTSTFHSLTYQENSDNSLTKWLTQGSELRFDLRSQDDAGFAAPLVLSPQPADIPTRQISPTATNSYQSNNWPG